jgi:hypothetical protein
MWRWTALASPILDVAVTNPAQAPQAGLEPDVFECFHWLQSHNPSPLRRRRLAGDSPDTPRTHTVDKYPAAQPLSQTQYVEPANQRQDLLTRIWVMPHGKGKGSDLSRFVRKAVRQRIQAVQAKHRSPAFLLSLSTLGPLPTHCHSDPHLHGLPTRQKVGI